MQLYFCINALYLLSALPESPSVLDTARRWILKCLFVQEEGEGAAGFVGGTSIGGGRGIGDPHLAMTYAAICSLYVLSPEDVVALPRDKILMFVASQCLKDGSIRASRDAGEVDVRFVYCACAICSLLGQEPSKVFPDVEATVAWIQSCQTYEGGFGLRPGNEAHGGSTYCAVASLSLLGNPLKGEEEMRLLHWLSRRQGHGFCGRPNKPDDTCYSFWIGAAMHILKVDHWIDKPSLIKFILETQDEIRGACGRDPTAGADPLHGYFALCGLSLSSFPGIPCIDPSLGVPLSCLHQVQRLRAEKE